MNKVAAKAIQDKFIQDTKPPVLDKRNELNNPANLVEQQVIEHAWGDIAGKNPLRARLIRELLKLDEAASLGGPLSVAILNNLPVACCSNGQKIPDDFHLARAHNLVRCAVGIAEQLVRTQSANDISLDQTGIRANAGI
ncbi:MAG TPA: hypothetical protein VIM41_06355 [Gammaproteobacteria bacterium]